MSIHFQCSDDETKFDYFSYLLGKEKNKTYIFCSESTQCQKWESFLRKRMRCDSRDIGLCNASTSFDTDKEKRWLRTRDEMLADLCKLMAPKMKPQIDHQVCQLNVIVECDHRSFHHIPTFVNLACSARHFPLIKFMIINTPLSPILRYSIDHLYQLKRTVVTNSITLNSIIISLHEIDPYINDQKKAKRND